MIYRDELKRFFRLIRKHEDLLVSSYLDYGGVVEEADDETAVYELVDARLLWRPDINEPARFTRELYSLFERVLRDPRRLTLDADIGGFIKNIETSVDRYKDSVRKDMTDDAAHYLGQIERLVDELRNSLSNRAEQLWEKINSEFGYVTSLDLKIKENEAVLEQATRLNDSIEIISVREINELAGNDYQLRKFLTRWLLDSVETCRRTVVDAIHKLNNLLFVYKDQRKLGRLIDTFYRTYQKNPGYRPADYSELNKIPEVFNQVDPIEMSGHANIEDPAQELTLMEIIDGLRKELLDIEEADPSSTIEVMPDQPPIQQTLPPLSQAVEDFYLKVIETNQQQSALQCVPSIDVEPDMEIWLYAVISRFNHMDQSERALFNIEYLQETDPVFNGRSLVQDVHVSMAP